jgi:hypothetical protein
MLTWGKLLVLLRHLPPESAMNTAIRNDTPEKDLALHGAESDYTAGKWSSIESMLATVIDEMRLSRWTYVQAHSESAIPKPTPIPRPGLPSRYGKVISIEDAQKIDPRLRGLSRDEAQAMLDRMSGRGR